MPDHIFPSTGASDIFNAGYSVPGALVIEFDEQSAPLRSAVVGSVRSSYKVYDFMVQGINFNFPEKTQNNTGLSDSLQVYTFGRDVRPVSIVGYVLYKGQANHTATRDLVQDWESKLRARKAAEKQKATMTLSMGGMVIKMLPLQLSYDRNANSDQYATVTFNGICLTVNGK